MVFNFVLAYNAPRKNANSRRIQK